MTNGKDYTTVSIPTSLFGKIEKKIKKLGGFRSVSEFVMYVLRESIAGENTNLKNDVERIKTRLKALGYSL